MIKIDKEDSSVVYPEEVTKLGIPRSDDKVAITYRLQIIWQEFGDETFELIHSIYEKSFIPSSILNMESFAICEIDIYYCYLARISHLLEDDYKKACSEYYLEKVFPLKSVITSEEITIEKKLSGDIFMSCEFDFTACIYDYVRAKLALFELLFLFTEEEGYLSPLLFFSKTYYDNPKSKELIFERNILNEFNLTPWSTAKSNILYSKIAYMNYPFIYNKVASTKERSTLYNFYNIELPTDKNQRPDILSDTPRKVTFHVLREKGLVKNGWDDYEKSILKYYDEVNGVVRSRGCNPKSHREPIEINPMLNSQYGAFELFNYCTDMNKYHLIRKTDYEACFDKHLERIYFRTLSGHEAPSKLMELLKKLPSKKA